MYLNGVDIFYNEFNLPAIYIRNWHALFFVPAYNEQGKFVFYANCEISYVS